MAKKSAKKSPAKKEIQVATNSPAKANQTKQIIKEKPKQKAVNVKPTPPVEVKKEAPKVAPKAITKTPPPVATKKESSPPPPIVVKKETPKATPPPAKEKKKEAPKKLSLSEQTYGTDAPKEVSPFPVSEIQTQTHNLVKELYIDVTRLPQEIVDATNSFLVEFTQFANSPNMFQLIPVIQEKDLKAYTLIKAWAETKMNLLIQNKQIQDNALGKVSNAPVSQPANTPPQTEAPAPIPVPVFDNDKYQRDYAMAIEGSINATFQIAHWGYVPRDVVNQIIDGLDKQFKYEIALAEDGKNSVVKIINGEKIISTGLINIQ